MIWLLRGTVAAACWVAAAVVIGCWMILRSASPGSTLVHLLLYGPRWVLAVPLLVLLPPAAVLRLRATTMGLGLAAAAFAGLWGFNVPWRDLVPIRDDLPPTLRVLTCNVQNGDLQRDAFAALIRDERPDVVLLQENTLREIRRVLGNENEEWFVRTDGEFCVASRYPILSFESVPRPDSTRRPIAVRAMVAWRGRTIALVGVHLLTLRAGLQAVIQSPLGGFDTFREVTAEQSFESQALARYAGELPGAIVLAGDFNLTPEHPVYRRDWQGYTNAFSQVGWGLGHTMFTRRIGLRIDQVLSNAYWRPDRCWVGPDVGSAHRPVIADLVWNGPREDPRGRREEPFPPRPH